MENKETSLNFGSVDIFIAFTGTCILLMRMDGMSGSDFIAYLHYITFLAIFLFNRLLFFAIILGFAANLFGVFMLKETFFRIGEEVDFLDFRFLLEVKACLVVVFLKCFYGLWRLNENSCIYTKYFVIFFF